ncbi:four helix bundle protein [soil metagenome]
MTISQDKSRLFEERTINFSLMIIRLIRGLVSSQENKIIANQVIRSATSIGANYAEANNAASKVDFRNKIFIAKKEAAETKYWLRLLSEVNPGVSMDREIDETTQLLYILQKIVSTLKNGK